MRKYNKKANYNANPNYLDFLDALRKFFTNDQDIIPIILAFNFYVNGVYSTPLNDLFRAYSDNLEDIHGTEKTKTLIDDGTIGIINEAIYKQGNGSLLTALENTRVILENKKAAYNVGFNPISKTYTEALKTPVNVLPQSNPVTITNNYNQRLAEINKLYDEGDIGEGEYQKRLSELNGTTNPQVIGGGAGGGPVAITNNYNQRLAEINKLYDEGDIGEGEYQKRLSELNGTTNPQVIGGGAGGPGGGPVNNTFVAQQPKPKKKKSFWKYFSFLSYKQKVKK